MAAASAAKNQHMAIISKLAISSLSVKQQRWHHHA